MPPIRWLTNLWSNLRARPENRKTGLRLPTPDLGVRRLEQRRVLNGAVLPVDALVGSFVSSASESAIEELWQPLSEGADQHAESTKQLSSELASTVGSGHQSLQWVGTAGDDVFLIDTVSLFHNGLSSVAIHGAGGHDRIEFRVGTDSIHIDLSSVESGQAEFENGRLSWRDIDQVDLVGTLSEVQITAESTASLIAESNSLGGLLIAADGSTAITTNHQSDRLEIQASSIVIRGEISARESVEIQTDVSFSLEATGSIRSAGGRVSVDGRQGEVLIAGVIDVSHSQRIGGMVDIAGSRIGLISTAQVLAVGSSGGGRIQVGGSSFSQANADRVVVLSGAELHADSQFNGDGGEIVLWSRDYTKFGGLASVRGGQQQGDGGFVEVSSRGQVQLTGNLDLGASNGMAGTFLLDPKVIRITARLVSAPANVDTVLFDDAPDDLSIPVSALQNIVSGTILLQATDTIIIERLSLDLGLGGSLILNPDVNLILQTRNGTGDLQTGGIFFDDPNTFIQTMGTGAITIQAGVNADTTGVVSGFQGNANLQLGQIFASNGEIRLEASGAISLDGFVFSDNRIAVHADKDGDGVGSLSTSGQGGLQSSVSADDAIVVSAADIDLKPSSPSSPVIIATDTVGGIQIRSSAGSRPINLGGINDLFNGINLTDVELFSVRSGADGKLTIGDSSQNGEIRLTTASPMILGGALLSIVQDLSGSGVIILDDENSGSPALNGSSAAIVFVAGTGGITSTHGNNGIEDIRTNGANISFDTHGGIGTALNPIELQQIKVGSPPQIEIGANARPANSVHLNGVGELSLGRIQLDNTDLFITSHGALTQTDTWEVRHLFVQTLSDPAVDVSLIGGDNLIETFEFRSLNAVGDSMSNANLDLFDFDGLQIIGIQTTGNVSIESGGAVTQSGAIQADRLAVETNSLVGPPIDLFDAGNQVSVVHLKVTVNDIRAPGPGLIRFRDADGFLVSTISTTADIELSSGGTVTLQDLMLGHGLLLRGSGEYQLTSGDVDVAVVASATTASVNIRTFNDIEVGTVRGVSGARLIGLTSSFSMTSFGTIKVSDRIETDAGGVNLTMQRLLLGADLQTDGGAISLNPVFSFGDGVFLTNNIVIDTERGNDSDAGSVFSSLLAISADAPNRALRIDTSSLGSVRGGTIFLLGFGNSGGDFVHDVVLVTNEFEVNGANQVRIFGPSRVEGTLLIERANITDFQNVIGTGDVLDITTNQLFGSASIGAANRIRIVPASAGRAIHLGTSDTGFLSLNSALLANLSAPVVQIGETTTGEVVVTGPSTLKSVGTLDLRSVAGITDTTTDGIAVHDLVLRAGQDITLDAKHDVDRLAVQLSGSTRSVLFRDVDELEIAMVEGVQGIITPGGGDTFLFAGGNLSQTALIKTDSLFALTRSDTPAEIQLNIAGNDANRVQLETLDAAGTVVVSAPVAFSDVDDLVISGIRTGNTAKIEAGGPVTQDVAILASRLEVVTRSNTNAGIDLFNAPNRVSEVRLETLDTAGIQPVSGLIRFASDVAYSIDTIRTAGDIELFAVGTVILNGEINGSGLLLAGNGNFLLGSATPRVDVSRLAATTTGTIVVADLNDLEIGNVRGVSGIQTGSSGIVVRVSANNELRISERVQVGQSNVTLSGADVILFNDVFTDGGAVSFVAPSAVGNGRLIVGVDAQIDTEQGRNSFAGNVSIIGLDLTAGSIGRSLLIDVSTGIGRVGGSIFIEDANDSGGHFLNDLRLVTNTEETDSEFLIRISGNAHVDSLLKVVAAKTTELLGSVTSAGDIEIATNKIRIGSFLGAANRIQITPAVSGRSINLGTDDFGSLGIDSSAFPNISTPILEIGDLSSGEIRVTQQVALNNTPVLDLRTGAGVTSTPSGQIRVSNLAIRAHQSIVLDEPQAVGRLAVEFFGTSGTVEFRDQDALEIGNVAGVSGIVMPANGSVLLSSGGPLTQTAAIVADTLHVQTLNNGGADILLTNADNDLNRARLEVLDVSGSTTSGPAVIFFGDRDEIQFDGIRTAGDVVLAAGGDITQSDGIKAAALRVRTVTTSGATIQLDDANNDVDVLSLRSLINGGSAIGVGDLVFRDQDGIVLDGIETLSRASITAGGSVIQTRAIQASELVVETRNDAGGAIRLDRLDNAVNSVRLNARTGEGTASALGAIDYVNSRALSVAGISTLSSIRLDAAGPITQTGGISGDGLAIVTRDDGTVAIDLQDQTNNVKSIDVRSKTTAGMIGAGAILYRNATDLSVTGIETLGDVTLNVGGNISQTGPISARSLDASTITGTGAVIHLDHPANDVDFLALRTLINGGADFGPGDVLFRDRNSVVLNGIETLTRATIFSGGDVTQTQAVRVDELVVETQDDTGGDIRLDRNDNVINSIRLSTRDALGIAISIGAVDITTSAGLAIAGIETAGAIHVDASGPVTQTSAIHADLLSIVSRDNGPMAIDLRDAGNEVNEIEFRARNLSGDVGSGAMFFRDATGFAVAKVETLGDATLVAAGDIVQTGPVFAGRLSATTLSDSGAAIVLNRPENDVDFVQLRSRSSDGSTVASGEIVFRDMDGFDIESLETNGTATLNADGPVVQSGPITVTQLALLGDGSFVLNDATNDVQMIAADIGGPLWLRTSSGIEVGRVNGISGIGVRGSDPKIELEAAGGIRISERIGAAGGSVRLLSFGSIIETGNGIIEADELAVRMFSSESATVRLLGSNLVDRVAIEARSGGIRFASGQSFIVGNIPADPVTGFTEVSGVRADNGDVELHSLADVTLVSRVDATGQVGIFSRGNVTETNGGEIQASELVVVQANPSDGNVLLNNNNRFGRLAVLNSAKSREVSVVVSGDLTISTLSPVFGEGSVVGIRTNNGNQIIKSGGVLVIDEDLQAGTGVIILDALGGVIENANEIRGSALAVQSGGDVSLETRIAATQFAATVTGVGKSIRVNATGDLLIDGSSSRGIGGYTGTGVTTRDGDVVLFGDQSLTINEAIVAGTSSVQLQISGDIIDGNSTASDLRGGLLTAVAGGGFGTFDNPIETMLQRIQIEAPQGVHLVNRGSLEIVGDGIAADRGGISITAMDDPAGVPGDLVINGQVSLNQRGSGASAAFGPVIFGPLGNPTGTDIELISTGDLIVTQPVFNFGSLQNPVGDIFLTAGGDLSLFDTGVFTDILANQGSVIAQYGGSTNYAQVYPNLSDIDITKSFIIASATASTAAVPPLIQVVQTPPAVSGDPTRFTVTVGRTGESGMILNIDFGDGTTDSAIVDSRSGPQVLVFDHFYPQPASGTVVFVASFTVDYDGSIQIQSKGSGVDTLVPIPGSEDSSGNPTQFYVVKGSGNQVSTALVAQATAVGPTPQPPPSGDPDVIDLNDNPPKPNIGPLGPGQPPPPPPPPALALGELLIRNEPVAERAEQFAPDLPLDDTNLDIPIEATNGVDLETYTETSIDRFVLREVAPDGVDLRTIDFSVFELGEIQLDPQVIRDQVFPKLPDGRYRIVWLRGTSSGSPVERSVLDVYIRKGRPAVIQDLQRPTVPRSPQAAGQSSTGPQKSSMLPFVSPETQEPKEPAGGSELSGVNLDGTVLRSPYFPEVREVSRRIQPESSILSIGGQS